MDTLLCIVAIFAFGFMAGIVSDIINGVFNTKKYRDAE